MPGGPPLREELVVWGSPASAVAPRMQPPRGEGRGGREMIGPSGCPHYAVWPGRWVPCFVRATSVLVGTRPRWMMKGATRRGGQPTSDWSLEIKMENGMHAKLHNGLR